MTQSDLILIESLESGRSHAICFLTDHQKRLINKVFGKHNLIITIDDLNRVSIIPGTVAIFD